MAEEKKATIVKPNLIDHMRFLPQTISAHSAAAKECLLFVLLHDVNVSIDRNPNVESVRRANIIVAHVRLKRCTVFFVCVN